MPPRRRIDPAAGRVALAAALEGADPEALATAVRFTLEELTARHPGHAVEVRVPPYGAAQCIAGVRHTRGTPPNVVETDAATWLALATGGLGWAEALAAGTLYSSGRSADLTGVLPLVSVAQRGSERPLGVRVAPEAPGSGG
jgi:hypothetical protein